MEVFRAFIFNETEHDVHIIIEGDEHLFRANDIATIFEIVNIRTSLTNFTEKQKVIRTRYSSNSGNQDAIYLTQSGLMTFIFSSRKKQIAEPFKEWVLKVITTIGKTGEYKLQHEVLENRASYMEKKLLESVERKQHENLVDLYADKTLVYFGKIRDEPDGTMLIKIGSTQDVKTRARSLAVEFGSMCFLKVFECPLYVQFEKRLQKHPLILQRVYREPIYKEHYSNGEVFKMTQEEYDEALRIAKYHVHRFRDQASLGQLLEFEKTRLHNNMLEASTSQEITQEPLLFDATTERKYTQARGNKMQRYSPDGKTLLNTYPGCAEASRDPNVDSPVATVLKQAVTNRTVYKGFRWAMLERDLPDETIQDIGETSETKTMSKGFVAMLNLAKTSIIRVFMDMKDASEDRQFNGCAAISKAVKLGTKSGGHYFKMWFDCSDELKQEYLSRASLPNPRVPVNGRVIEQIHPLSGEVLKTFSSVAHVQKELRIARLSLKFALENDTVIKGFRWRSR